MSADDAPLTTADCASYMHRSPSFILKMIREGHLPAHYVKLPGARLGRWQITQADFAAFLTAIGWHRIPKVG